MDARRYRLSLLYPGADCSAVALQIVRMLIERSYPKGNFGENQLPGGSMSLSPLCPGLAVTICTSVPHNAGFHQSFRLASPCLGIVHHLSGLNRGTRAGDWVHCGDRPLVLVSCYAFACVYDCCGVMTRATVELLGPCFKTGRMVTQMERTLQSPTVCGGLKGPFKRVVLRSIRL